ncbi:hypothetical protein FSP39_017026 [Pinctada imbricata]|uniref:HTH CENPB-type domain-containing protein n=1 Tax=Pinctada imbricata TaxID=66713 RepID=A0AA88YVK2_PINIB|nr:hypothetical protein FSP39_017026 [Pinctada imbricata]
MSLRKASLKFGIPKSTLHDTISKKYPSPGKPGRRPTIPIEIENRVARAVIEAARQGIGISKRQFLRRVGSLCKQIGIKFKKGNPGKEWYEGFKKRHPEVVIRKPEKIALSRARMVNKEVLNKYFSGLKVIIDELNLGDKPHLIWNADEVGKSFEHEPVRILAEKGSKNVVGRSSSNRTNITVLASVNASGDKMPPLMIVKGKTSKSLHGFNTSASPEKSRWFYQANSWMTDELGELWFKEIFLAECGPERPQLLILDGHSSHETLAIIELAMEENIAILCLPPHTTHVLQPLDRSVFGPLNTAYNTACSEYLNENILNNVSKWSFPGLFNTAWEKAVTTTIIQSGFKACGIVPYNPSAVPDDMVAPSIPTDVPLQADTPLEQSADEITQDMQSQDAQPQDPPSQDAPSQPDVQPEISLNTEAPGPLCADTAEVVLEDPAVILQLLQSGGIDIFSADGDGIVNIPEQANTVTEITETLISNLFTPANEERKKTQVKRKLCTSHRLLTSDAILEEKRQMAARKAENEKKKNERMIKRKCKSEQKH